MIKIEATGNTEAQATNSLDLKRLDVLRACDAEFGEIVKYGNFELGYKLVQYYKTKI